MSPQRDNDYPEDVDERTSTSVDVGRARESADADAPYVPDPMASGESGGVAGGTAGETGSASGTSATPNQAAGGLTADERSQAPREDREADNPRGAGLQPRPKG
jgi:hypothetical protein